jgi:UDP-N-acetylmuramate dehydrogenase
MLVQQNISLRPFNTFGIDVMTRQFGSFHSLDALEEMTAQAKDEPMLILGGGSNLLFTHDFDGLVLKNELKGITCFREDDDYYYVKASAGENWHGFVAFCVETGYAGIENLSLIPGNVGASPMQNIGAYGVEIKDVFYELEAYHLGDRAVKTFNLEDCEFGYRESVFKKKYRNQFVILSVSFRLRKKPVFNTSYGAIEQELERMGVQQLSISAISQAVINIRSSKLPDPAKIGNAGSFFKNPIVSREKYEALAAAHANIPGYEAGRGNMKLAAGWLIEQCGWKGYRKGDAGCYSKQALVLVNYGHATGEEVYALSEEIISSVRDRFGVALEREVNVI